MICLYPPSRVLSKTAPGIKNKMEEIDWITFRAVLSQHLGYWEYEPGICTSFSDFTREHHTGKKIIFQHWKLIGLSLWYHWYVIGKPNWYSNIGKWLYLPILVNHEICQHWIPCFQYWTTIFSNIGKVISNIGLWYTPILDKTFPTLDNRTLLHWTICFQHWTIVYSNTGQNVSNIG